MTMETSRLPILILVFVFLCCLSSLANTILLVEVESRLSQRMDDLSHSTVDFSFMQAQIDSLMDAHDYVWKSRRGSVHR
jgi:hypothetical protein